jgi:hypothetical protein
MVALVILAEQVIRQSLLLLKEITVVMVQVRCLQVGAEAEVQEV